MNLPNEVLSLKNRTPKAEKPKNSTTKGKKVVELDWRAKNAELITLDVGKTGQVYIDRAMDSLTTVWDTNYPLDGATEEAREKQALRQLKRKNELGVIAQMCSQAQEMKGTPQERANKIISALITRKMLDVILLFIESMVKRVAVSAYFEHRRYEAGTAVNPDIAMANLERLRECHALNGHVLEGEDGEEMFRGAFDAVHDKGESTWPSENHTLNAPSSTDAIQIAAVDAEDAELSAYAVQQWASAYWRLMTNNKEQADVLPFAIERVEQGVYRNYTEFLPFCDYRTESYQARLQREKLSGLEALEAVRNKIVDDGFTIKS